MFIYRYTAYNKKPKVILNNRELQGKKAFFNASEGLSECVCRVMSVALSESVSFVSLCEHDTAYQLLCSNRSKRRRQEENSSEAHQETFGSCVPESSDVFYS